MSVATANNRSRKHRPRGRPPEPVPEDIAERVLEWLSTGRPLAAFCSKPGNPSRRTVHDWRKKDPEFRRQFEFAREFGFWSLCDEVIMIADEEAPDGKLTHAFLARQRERIRVRFWLMSRWYPKGTRAGGRSGRSTSTEVLKPQVRVLEKAP